MNNGKLWKMWQKIEILNSPQQKEEVKNRNKKKRDTYE